MPYITYGSHNLRRSSLAIVSQANKIIAEYQQAGFKLTLRQLYYQFVARGFIANKQTEYKRLGSIINDGRLAGMIDWDAIEDRGRNLKTHPAWSSPASLIKMCAEELRKYEQKFMKLPTVYLYRCEIGIRSYADVDLKVSMQRAGLAMTEFDIRNEVDSYSLPNLIATMRSNRFSLVDEIYSTPLRTLDSVFEKVSE